MATLVLRHATRAAVRQEQAIIEDYYTTSGKKEARVDYAQRTLRMAFNIFNIFDIF
jgi:hypothetical protein